MKFLAAIALFALAVLAKDNSDVTELKIDTTFKPEECTQTAAKGDKIKARLRAGIHQSRLLIFCCRCTTRARSTRPAQSSTPGARSTWTFLFARG